MDNLDHFGKNLQSKRKCQQECTVQEAEFLNHICFRTKHLGVSLQLDARSINNLKARTAKNGEKLCRAFFKFEVSILERSQQSAV